MPQMGAGVAMQDCMGQPGQGRMNLARMQARIDKRNADLKAQLKITATQEAAWTTYVAAMKPPASKMTQPSDWAEIVKLPTPERIDKMKTLRTQHMLEMNAAMDKHGEASKALYAALTPEQQKVFDAQAMGRPGRGGPMGGQHHGKF